MSNQDPCELKSSNPSYPWYIGHPHLMERCMEGFDSQPMTPPTHVELKEPPRIKARRSKYWSLLGEQEHIPEKSEVKSVIATDLRTFIKPIQDGEEIKFMQTHPVFGLHSDSEHNEHAGELSEAVSHNRLSAGSMSSCDEGSTDSLHRTMGHVPSDDLMANFLDEMMDQDSSSQDEFGPLASPSLQRCHSENSASYFPFGTPYKTPSQSSMDVDEEDSGYRKRSASTTDLMMQSRELANKPGMSLMSKIHNKFSASAEALRQMKRNADQIKNNADRTRHASGPELSTEGKEGSTGSGKQEPEHHKVALNAMLMSS